MKALLAAIASILLMSSVASAGDITYNIVDYPAVENGTFSFPGLDGTGFGTAYFSLSGQITTNGTIGPLYPTDIVSSSFSASLLSGSAGQPLWSCSFSGSNVSILEGAATGSNPLIASSTQVLLPQGNIMYLQGQYLDHEGESTASTLGYWNEEGLPGSPTYNNGQIWNTYEFAGPSYYTGDTVNWWVASSTSPLSGTPTPILPYAADGTSWVIAQTVPEPSTIVLLGVGAIGFLGYRWRRQKRAADRPDA